MLRVTTPFIPAHMSQVQDLQPTRTHSHISRAKKISVCGRCGGIDKRKKKGQSERERERGRENAREREARKKQHICQTAAV